MKLALQAYFLAFSLILIACAGNPQVESPVTQTPLVPKTEISPTSDSQGTPVPILTNVRVEDDTEYLIPSMMGFDAIAPIYMPSFASVQDAPMKDTELVMGVAIHGQAKAYPVNVLRFREMVNDELAGWPILVTW